VRRLLLVLTLAVAAPVAIAQEATSKREIIERSAPICRDALEAIQPHIVAMDEAERSNRPRKFVRHGRRLVDKVRPRVRELDELSPQSDGRRRYRKFVNNTDSALDWLDAAFDALAAGRVRLSRSRAETAVAHTNRARRAARRFGLRDSCVTLVS
jgi:hypothetical protein